MSRAPLSFGDDHFVVDNEDPAMRGKHNSLAYENADVGNVWRINP